MEESTSPKINAVMNAALQTINLEDQSKSMSIDELNDYCLDKIFSYLRVDDRACCERVCRRWENIIKDSWLNIKKLDSSKSMWELIKKEYKLRNKNTQMDKRSLSRFGKYLDYLHLHNYDELKYSDLSRNISKYCPNIGRLYTLHHPIPSQVLLELSKNGKQIFHLSISQCQPGCEEGFSELFRNNRKLNFIYIGDFDDVTGECFLHLPSANSIEFMSLVSCYNIKPHWLNSALKKFVNLSSLRLDQCLGVDESTFETISKLTKITEFTFSPDSAQSLPTTALRFLANLVNLKYLVLSDNSAVTDDLLCDLSNHCKKLVKLELNRCEFITDRGIMALLENSQNLEYLLLSGTRITQKTFEAADRVASSRRKKLSFKYSKRDFRSFKFCPKSKFLHLGVNENHPRRHFVRSSSIHFTSSHDKTSDNSLYYL